MNIPLVKPYFDRKEEEAVIKTLRSGWVTQGPKVEELENVFAKYIGVKYAVAVSSATTALFLSLYIKGIGPQDEVIIPSLTFIATANVVVHTGAKPVFVDIDPMTLNIDSEKIEKAITKKTRAIIPVDQFGLPCDLDKIIKIAKKHKLTVIEDSACAIGSKYKGRKVGSISEITCFSFHPRKLITTGDGGIIATNSKKIADKARLLRNQGMAVSDVVRHTANRVIFEKYPVVGFNFRMTDIQAAIGVEQMKKLPKILENRTRLANRYTRMFSKSEIIIPPFLPAGLTPNWQTYGIRLRKNIKISREDLMQKLLDAGIATRRGQMACHLEAPYRKMYPKLTLPETEKTTKETIALPLYPQMTRKEQDYVIFTLLKLLRR